MKRKTEDHGTTLTTWEMLTPNLKFKFTTYKEPGQIITTASCRRVEPNERELYSYGSEYMVEVDRTYHKRVTAPMVQSHHRSDVAGLYDHYLKLAIQWNEARNKMPRPLTEEEQEAKDAEFLKNLQDVGIYMADTATTGTETRSTTASSALAASYRSGTISTTSGMGIIESPRTGEIYDGLPVVHQRI